MPTIADAISKENVHHLHDKFVEGVLVLEENRGKAKQLGINAKIFDRVGEPILRYVHQELIARSINNGTTVLPDYPRVSKAKVSEVLRMDRVADVRLVGDVSRLLQYAGVARYNRADATWYLRDWSYANVAYIGTSDWAAIRPDPRVDKRIEEEKDTPVTKTIDLRILKPAGTDAASIMEFVNTFIPAAIRVQQERDHLAGNLVALRAEMLILQEAQTEAKSWEGVGTKINKLLGAK